MRREKPFQPIVTMGSDGAKLSPKYRKFMAIFEHGLLVRIDRGSDTWLTLSWVDPE
jgi:hypothetical protein